MNTSSPLSDASTKYEDSVLVPCESRKIQPPSTRPPGFDGQLGLEPSRSMGLEPSRSHSNTFVKPVQPKYSGSATSPLVSRPTNRSLLTKNTRSPSTDTSRNAN